jgi:hypothetical protein
MVRKLSLFSLLTIQVVVMSMLMTSAGPSSAAGLYAPGGTMIDAVLLKSWGNCGASSLIWDSLNTNWQSYGSIPIHVDYSFPGLCDAGDEITLSKLEASGADVLIISNPSGRPTLYSAAEAQAIREYANEGHNLIGTYLLVAFRGTDGETYDNRVLAPLFGLTPGVKYTGGHVKIRPIYVERTPSSPLFRGVGNPYESLGFEYSQTPADGAWSDNELTTAELVARTGDTRAAILVQQASASRSYSSVYITNMAEYQGSTTDEQFFYNAIIFPATG